MIQMSPATGAKTCIRSLLLDHDLACVATLLGIAVCFLKCVERKDFMNLDIQPLPGRLQQFIDVFRGWTGENDHVLFTCE
jgi:hypothetical protein